MEVYFFKPDVYADLYNCSQLTQHEWEAVGVRRPFLALALGLVGTTFALIYIPFLFIMTRKQFFKLSCYKIMFCLGFIDAHTIILAVGVGGYMSVNGTVFCTLPRISYLTGAGGVASWCGSCLLCIILALNRCLDIYYHRLHELLFHGARTYIWMLGVFIYMFMIMWFEPPVLYHSRYGAAFYDPFLGAPVVKQHQFVNYTHVINNVVVVIVMPLLYILLSLYVMKNGAKLSKSKKNIVLQTILICSPFTIAAGIYDYMQFFTAPEWLSMVGHTFYMVTGSSAGVVYWLFNSNLRRELIRRLHGFSVIPLNKVFHTMPNTSTHRSGSSI